MEGNTNWRPNQKGGDSVVNNNANDWRSQLEPDIRKKVFHIIVGRLKRYFPTHPQERINETVLKFEETAFRIAINKGDYMSKLKDKMNMMEQRFRELQSLNLQSGSSAQVVNQGQSLPTSLSNTQTATSQQQWIPQNNQSNLNVPGSSGLQNQVSITVSGAQNINIQMNERVSSNLRPGSQTHMQGRLQQQQQPQQQPQNPNYTLQHQMDQQVLKDKIRHGNLRPPYMQQQPQTPQQQQQSPLKRSIQQQPQTSQQLPQQTTFSTISQSFPQSSTQFVPRNQFPTQQVGSSHQQIQQKREELISQLMNGQNHLTSQQNNGEQQQGAFRVSSSHQNNISGFQAMAQQNNNLQKMHQRRFSSQSNNNASALPLQQQQKMLGGQSGNFNGPRSDLLDTQGPGQSQPMMTQQCRLQHPMQQQQPQRKALQQNLDCMQSDPQRFQAAGSLQQNQPSLLQRAPVEHSSTSQDSTGQTVNVSGGDWQEEIYQKMKSLKDTHMPALQTIHQRVKEKLWQNDSLPQEKRVHDSEAIEKLRGIKLTLEHIIMFLNVPRSDITERHIDKLRVCEEHILKVTRHQSGLRRPIQQQQQAQSLSTQMLRTPSQSQSPLPQVHNDQINSRLMMPSYQDGASSSVSSFTTSMPPRMLQTRPKIEPKDEKNTMASLKQNPASNPQLVHPNINSVQSSLFHHRQKQEQLPRKQQQQQANQQTNEMNDVKMKQGINIKAGLLQQHLSSSQRQLPKPLGPSAIQQHQSSLQLVDQQSLPTTVNKTETPSQSGGSPFVTPSPATTFAPFPTPGEPENPISVESPASSFGAVMKPTLCFPGNQEHPPFTLPPEPSAKRPIDRLIKAFQSSSPKSLAESVSEMSSVISMSDRYAGSFYPGGGFEDLSAMTEFDLQAKDFMTHGGETNPSKRLKRSLISLPQDITSQFDNFDQFSSLESEVDSTASSGSNANKIEPNYALLQEIKEINGTFVETVIDIYDVEVISGTIVTCSYSPVALSTTFMAHYKSGKIVTIQPLRLLVPANYPYSPPKLLEQIPLDASVMEYEDLSARTRLRFSLSLRKLSEQVSLKDIAQTWNDCARETMVEYAERYGGGTFSSKYGYWENVQRAS